MWSSSHLAHTGAREEGLFDRRTEHGRITWFRADKQREPSIYGKLAETVFKQFILECKASPPAKF